jgi:hypothetical protein
MPEKHMQKEWKFCTDSSPETDSRNGMVFWSLNYIINAPSDLIFIKCHFFFGKIHGCPLALLKSFSDAVSVKFKWIKSNKSMVCGK